MTARIFLAIWVVLSFIATHAQSLPERMDALLNDDVLKTSEVGIAVFDLTTGESLYRYQDEKLYRPASVEKIITSVTALSQLGTAYTMDTRLHYTGKIDRDTLRGSLYLVGGFDPKFTDEDLNRLVEAVERSGIRYIADTLAADVSMTDSVYWGKGWSWDDTPASFQPYLSPLMLNGGCVDVSVSPTQKGELPRVVCSPVSDYYKLNNRAASYTPYAGKLKVTRNWLNNGNIITVSGNSASPSTEKLNVFASSDFFFQTFIGRLRQKGIWARVNTYADSPVGKNIITIQRPLKEVLGEALKMSDNLCAESMFYHLATKHAMCKEATSDDGTDAVNAFIKVVLGLNPDNYKIVDGSGVSLYNYISPHLLVEYLKYAYYHSDLFLPFYESLPIAGVDGTLQHRMKQTKAQGNVRAKTGTVTGISSLAGYAKASNGHQLAFVIINQNVLKAAQARAFQDKVCGILVR